MAAILTDKFKKNILIDIEEDINDDASTNEYYLVYGKPSEWEDDQNPPMPLNNRFEEQKLINNAILAKKITDCSLVIPRRDWVANNTYSKYTTQNINHNPSNSDYVITSDYQVYVCIQPNGTLNGNTYTINNSTIEPEGIDPSPVNPGDGYLWKYMYTVGPLRANTFMSSAYMPVDRFTNNEATDVQQRQDVINQIAVQDAAVPGQIISYVIEDGGANYSAGTTVSIVGDGGTTPNTIAAATPVINSLGVIKEIIADDFGSNYTYASVVINDPNGTGNGAKITPVITSLDGLGYDPRVDLRASAVMFKTVTDGNADDDLIIDNDFRQIAIVKNPVFKGTNDIFTDPTGNPLKYLNLTDLQYNFTADNYIVGETSGARALVVRHDDNTNVLYIIQNEDTGFGAFDLNEYIREENGEGRASVITNDDENDDESIVLNTPEIDLNKSEVLFIDNRHPVSRSSEQKEDIKIIIQL